MTTLLTSKADYLQQCRGNRRAFLYDVDSALNNQFCGVYTCLWVLYEIASYAYACMLNWSFCSKIFWFRCRILLIILPFCSLSWCVARGSGIMGAIFSVKKSLTGNMEVIELFFFWENVFNRFDTKRCSVGFSRAQISSITTHWLSNKLVGLSLRPKNCKHDNKMCLGSFI